MWRGLIKVWASEQGVSFSGDLNPAWDVGMNVCKLSLGV